MAIEYDRLVACDEPEVERDRFGGIVSNGGGSSFHQQVQQLTQNTAQEANAEATGDIMHREAA